MILFVFVCPFNFASEEVIVKYREMKTLKGPSMSKKVDNMILLYGRGHSILFFMFNRFKAITIMLCYFGDPCIYIVE